MKNSKTIGTLSLFALWVFFLASQSFGQEKITVRIGSPFKAGHILVDAAEKFKELVARGTLRNHKSPYPRQSRGLDKTVNRSKRIENREPPEGSVYSNILI